MPGRSRPRRPTACAGSTPTLLAAPRDRGRERLGVAGRARFRRCRRARRARACPCSSASTTPTRRVAVSMPSSSISARSARRRSRRVDGAQPLGPRRPVRGELERAGRRRRHRASRRTSSRSGGSTPRDRVAPLDDRDRALLEQLLEAEVVQLLDALEPVHVDVREREPPVVLLHDRERRARHGLGDAEPARDALARTSVLPAPRSPVSTHEVADSAGAGRRPRRRLRSRAHSASSTRSSRQAPRRARASRARSRHATSASARPPERSTADGCSVGISTASMPARLNANSWPAQLRDAFLGLEQQLGREVAERDDDARSDQLELAVEPRRARLDLVRLRVAVPAAAGTSRRSRCTRRRG